MVMVMLQWLTMMMVNMVMLQLMMMVNDGFYHLVGTCWNNSKLRVNYWAVLVQLTMVNGSKEVGQRQSMLINDWKILAVQGGFIPSLTCYWLIIVHPSTYCQSGGVPPCTSVPFRNGCAA